MTRRKLTPKQQIFIDEYLKCWNATEAARRAGYKHPNKVGPENLVKLGIQESIEQRLKDNAMTADEALSRLADIARSDIGDFISPESLTIDIRNGDTSLIKKIKYRIFTKDDEQTEMVELELYSRLDAIKTILRGHGVGESKDINIHDWRSQAIEDIKAGRLTYKALEAHFDGSLAAELFRAAGVPLQTE